MNTRLAYLPSVRRVVCCVPSYIESPEDALRVVLGDDMLADIGGYSGVAVVVSLRERVGHGQPGAVRHEGAVYAGYVYYLPTGGVRLSDHLMDDETTRFEEGAYEVLGPVVRVCLGEDHGACYAVPPPSELALHWMADADGNHIVTEEMRLGLSLTGCDPEEWQGWNWEQFLHPNDRCLYVARWRRAVRTGKSYYNRGRICLGGTWVYITVRGEPVRDHKARVIRWEGAMLLDAAESRQTA